MCLLTEKVDEELLTAAPKLRIAATVSVGYDNIDVPACTRHKVVATNTPGVLDDTTADFAWTLLMAIARRVVEGDTLMRAGTWPVGTWTISAAATFGARPSESSASAASGATWRVARWAFTCA